MPTNYFEILDDNPEQIDASIKLLLAEARKTIGVESGRVADYLDLKGWCYVGHIKTSNKRLIVARSLTEPNECPRCGAPSSMHKHNAWTRLQCKKDEPRGLHHVHIYFQLQRYKCRKCGKPSQQPIEGMAQHRGMTERLLNLIHRQIFKKPFARLSQETGVGEQTIHNISADYMEKLIETVKFETPVRMGIDGVYIGGIQRCVIVDLDKGRPIALLPECTYEALVRFFIQLPNRQRVKQVTMDMTLTFANAVYRWLPRADIVIDTYHFQSMANKNLYDALKHLRKDILFKRLHKEYLKEQRGRPRKRQIKCTRFLLFKRRTDLDEEALEVLENWTKKIPQLRVWYDLKERFLNVFQLLDRRKAEERYDLWEQDVERDLPGGFRKLRKAMRRWRRAIFNYFDDRATNALTEAVNGRIKELQRNGRGYKFEVLKALLLYAEYKEPRRRKSRKTRHRKSLPINPNSKVGRLQAAYRTQDQTLGLLPNSSQTGGWKIRFKEVMSWLSEGGGKSKHYRLKTNKASINKEQGLLFDINHQ